MIFVASLEYVVFFQWNFSGHKWSLIFKHVIAIVWIMVYILILCCYSWNVLINWTFDFSTFVFYLFSFFSLSKLRFKKWSLCWIQLAALMNVVSVIMMQLYIHICVQIHRDFILPSEREGFILRMYDIINRAESMMHQQQPADGDRLSHLTASVLLESMVCVCEIIFFWSIFIKHQKTVKNVHLKLTSSDALSDQMSRTPLLACNKRMKRLLE